MAKVIMVQGTMSGAGKSLLVAGLCRVFHRRGFRVAPFKSQNMALNSFITREGLEMGRAQVVQAEACGAEPSVLMNPILLKPTTDVGSQVIVNGEVLGNMSAAEYFAMKKSLIPHILRDYETLAAKNDVIVIEGAGSPAEINLKADDIVNMGLAKLVRAPVLLVGDIDRGGVFAQLYGTVALLEPEERRLVKGTVINKFRGDVEILRPGLAMLEELTGVPVAGVLPYLHVDLEDEDSLTDRFARRSGALLDVAVVHLPHISNFTDFSALEATEGVAVRYVDAPRRLGAPDLVILPGTKSTIADLLWMRQNGLEAAVKKLAAAGTPVCGICGGYQMLGRRITDRCGAEGGGSVQGMELLPMTTDFAAEKHRTRVRGAVICSGAMPELQGAALEGYEIHMGETTLDEGARPLARLDNGAEDGCVSGTVWGSYLHGFFDTAESREALLALLCRCKGIDGSALAAFDYAAYKERQYDLLADAVEQNLDMERIGKIMEEGVEA
ncbi:MAG: cobyric acid synthase [Oscillospiraceae bacterium]|nr:cobyric acid synthase [Oscillospiraceae bacterium]